MSIAAKIRFMYDNGLMRDTPDEKKRVARIFGITVQTVHATLKNHLAGKFPTTNRVTFPPVPKSKSNPKHTDFESVIDAVNQRYNECYAIAESKGYRLGRIPIKYDLRGTSAGMFCVRFGARFFRVNLVLAKENIDTYLKNTVPHEFCHYMVYERVGLRERYFQSMPKPHGYEWKKFMIQVFGLNPKRCHSYNTANAANRPYVYACACQEFHLSALLHRRIRSGQRRHCCRCKMNIVFKRIER